MKFPLIISIATLVLNGCSSRSSSSSKVVPFELKFAAMVDGKQAGCNDNLSGLGPAGAHHLGINDLRFYLSNIRLLGKDGAVVDMTLDQNEFQYNSPEGSVSLIDLTGNTEGSCGAASVAFAEGTARTHFAITGQTVLKSVTGVSFDVGIPQAVMKKNIATNTPEGSPSPLNEMYWNWNYGYRHFVFNFNVRDGADQAGGGYIHLGSIGCAPEGDASKALEDRDSCSFVNTPAVAISDFNLEADTIGLDLRKIVEGIDFISPIYDPETFTVIGEGPGVECHSSPMQSDCPLIFNKFGLDVTNGTANPTDNSIFKKM